jgi:hypothetical protein
MSHENKSDILKACFFKGPLVKKEEFPNIFILVQSGPCCVKDSIMSGTQLRKKIVIREFPVSGGMDLIGRGAEVRLCQFPS